MRNQRSTNRSQLRAATVAMAALFLFTGVGFVITYHVQKWIQQSAQLESSESEHTVTLYMTKAQLQRVLVEEHEIMVQGEFYDIRTIRESGDMIEITAVHDKFEKKLRNVLISALQHPDTPSKHAPYAHWLKVTFSPATVETPVDCFPPTRLQTDVAYGVPVLLSNAHPDELERPPSGAAA